MSWKKKMTLVILIVFLLVGSFHSGVWAWEKWSKDDPVTDEWNMIDLVVARPAGVLAGIAGTGLFILTLPFTIPSGGVNDAAERLIVSPFKFSFGREYPDDNM
jgi:hypothetical protein